MIRKTLREAGIIALGSILLCGMVQAAEAPLPDAPSFVKARQEGMQWIVKNGPDAESAVLDAVPQAQQIYTPPQENVLPGFSSSVADRYPVPGAAPALHSSCQPVTCLRIPPSMCCGSVRLKCVKSSKNNQLVCKEFAAPFTQYLNLPGTAIWTWRDNAHLAIMHVIDPFNLGTIAADAIIGIASDSHTPYGPGVEGVAKYAGVSLTEDMTGEFVGTFLIPSPTHQDPRYHRVPYLSTKQRILHAVTQVVWTQSDTGKPMPNYGNIVGSVATASISNIYVPGQNRQGVANTAKRLGIAFAFSPTGNLIAEFFPDIANRLNLRVVIFQRILNTISIEESGVGVH